jgi:hypothetical protein
MKVVAVKFAATKALMTMKPFVTMEALVTTAAMKTTRAAMKPAHGSAT